ncbi:hypothetical protein GQX74_005879 [Glossina fuscipes]|nr:hypothetical protein GQX74_005879 [Glossina fuscipes]
MAGWSWSKYVKNGTKLLPLLIIKTSMDNYWHSISSDHMSSFPSFELEKLQTNADYAIEEFNTLDYRTRPNHCDVHLNLELILKRATRRICLAVLREESVSSHREMMASLLKANFEVHDVTMCDLLEVKTSLDHYRAVIFPRGFSQADTLGSAKGWAANIMLSETLAPQFQTFKQTQGYFFIRDLQWVSINEFNRLDVPDVALLHNKSEWFECRWATLCIASSKAMMLSKLNGSVLGCWVALDDNAKPTDVYPMNPNGAAEGIAGLCSREGRHLAMMPHLERCHAMFKWPYISPASLFPFRIFKDGKCFFVNVVTPNTVTAGSTSHSLIPFINDDRRRRKCIFTPTEEDPLQTTYPSDDAEV